MEGRGKDSPRHPSLDNHGMGTIFEELIRRFNEENNEEAGEHWTPRDVVELMGDMVFSSVSDKIKNSTCTCCDGACGTGGMLTVAQERLTALAKANGKKVSIHPFGWEILDPRFNAAIGACPHAPKWTNQALKERLRQCPHPDVKNTVRPSRRLEHIRLSP